MDAGWSALHHFPRCVRACLRTRLSEWVPLLLWHRPGLLAHLVCVVCRSVEQVPSRLMCTICPFRIWLNPSRGDFVYCVCFFFVFHVSQLLWLFAEPLFDLFVPNTVLNHSNVRPNNRDCSVVLRLEEYPMYIIGTLTDILCECDFWTRAQFWKMIASLDQSCELGNIHTFVCSCVYSYFSPTIERKVFRSSVEKPSESLCDSTNFHYDSLKPKAVVFKKTTLIGSVIWLLLRTIVVTVTSTNCSRILCHKLPMLIMLFPAAELNISCM